MPPRVKLLPGAACMRVPLLLLLLERLCPRVAGLPGQCLAQPRAGCACGLQGRQAPPCPLSLFPVLIGLMLSRCGLPLPEWALGALFCVHA